MLKKIMSVSLSICLCMTAFTFSLSHASAEENIDLSNYIVSGSGTEADPYILSPDCPYKEELDNMAREIVQPTVMPLIDFSGTLTGTKHYNQYDGGVWRYTSGGPDGSYNGALCISGISYGNYEVTEVLYDNLNNSNVIVDALVDGLIGYALVNALTSYIGGLAAGVLSDFFLFAVANPNILDDSVIREAHSQREGLLEISYRTSYNSSWYATTCLDVWRTASSGMAQEPGSYYGVGVYTSN